MQCGGENGDGFMCVVRGDVGFSRVSDEPLDCQIIHAGSVEELRQKPLYADLLAARVFTFAVVIRREGGGRQYQVEELEC